MKQVYKLTSQKLEGCLRVAFEDGFLKSIEINFQSPLNMGQFQGLMISIPYVEEEIQIKSKQLGLACEKEIIIAANKKIAMFCEVYEKYNKVKYKATRQDGGKIREITITPDILDSYFQSDNFLFKGKHSISNLVRYYNELRIEISKKGKSSFPDSWSRSYAEKLSPDKLQAYWKHLRDLGLKPKKDGVGNTIDWIK